MCGIRKLRSFKRLKGITVLSLFDGMSCGQIALNRIGLNVDNYYASEVDKWAMQVTQHNHPNTTQIGSILDITIERVDRFTIILNGEYIIDTRKLILIGGSPCQGFSFAGTMSGSSTECNIDVTTLEQYLDLKSQDFKFKGQSYLFWEYMRVLRDVKPMYYFLENVKMIKKWKSMFNDAIGHEPIVINSALVSAQNRVRLYWTNIPGVTQPDDEGILIKDILQDNPDAKYYISAKSVQRYAPADGEYIDPYNKVIVKGDKTTTLRTNHSNGNMRVREIEDKYYMSQTFIESAHAHAQRHKKRGNGFAFKPILNLNTKAKTVTKDKNRYTNNYLIQAGTIDIKGHDQIKRVYSEKGKCRTLTTCTGGHREPKVLVMQTRKQLRLNRYFKRNKILIILIIPEATKQGYIEVQDGNCFDNTQPNSKTRRGRDMQSKSNCLTTSHQYMRYEHPRVRKLTPTECERLQTVPDGYTDIVSNSQRYKMLGNGWTVDVPGHIFKGLVG